MLSHLSDRETNCSRASCIFIVTKGRPVKRITSPESSGSIPARQVYKETFKSQGCRKIVLNSENLSDSSSLSLLGEIIGAQASNKMNEDTFHKFQCWILNINVSVELRPSDDFKEKDIFLYSYVDMDITQLTVIRIRVEEEST